MKTIGDVKTEVKDDEPLPQNLSSLVGQLNLEGLVWFSVKTVYMVSVHGRPKGRDEFYDAENALAEERVVLFRARNYDEALAKAEADALTRVSIRIRMGKRYDTSTRARRTHSSYSTAN